MQIKHEVRKLLEELAKSEAQGIVTVAGDEGVRLLMIGHCSAIVAMYATLFRAIVKMLADAGMNHDEISRLLCHAVAHAQPSILKM